QRSNVAGSTFFNDRSASRPAPRAITSVTTAAPPSSHHGRRTCTPSRSATCASRNTAGNDSKMPMMPTQNAWDITIAAIRHHALRRRRRGRRRHHLLPTPPPPPHHPHRRRAPQGDPPFGFGPPVDLRPPRELLGRIRRHRVRRVLSQTPRHLVRILGILALGQ